MLGLIEVGDYPVSQRMFAAGDALVMYTDGVSEALNEAGDELGRDGLMDLAQSIDLRSAEAFGSQLASALCRFRGKVAPADDATLIVLEIVPLDRYREAL